ncbi:MAG: PhoPQ-activated pathogenicity [Phycisphaeraceae bacterium]|nr:MAG: PhoPQ-activated pathogenicity [Phycisphaeraceae bacterium]
MRLCQPIFCAALVGAVSLATRAGDGAIDNSTVANTLLDRYTAHRDASFAFELERIYTDHPGFTGYAVNLTSQTWRSADEVDFPQWTHMLEIVRPDDVETDTALLVVAGGQRRVPPPDRLSSELYMIAGLTHSVVVKVPNVPNQPLTLNGDGEIRFEDDLLAESWTTAAKTKDMGWIVHLAMVQSACAAMDATQGFLKTDEGGNIEINRFVVTGASKRGWTTWLTACEDDRVVGIIPMVIDVLDLPVTMRHHWGAYGFWAPAIGDYASRKLFRWLNSPDSRALRSIVDPYLYRDRLDMPKFLLNSGGDQYFLPDTTRYYLDDLPGLTRLRVVPNTNHSLSRSPDAVQSAVAFYEAVLKSVEIPALHWERGEPGVLRVTADAEPFEVTLWQAHNPEGRDFRQEKIGNAWTSTPLEAQDGAYVAEVPVPDQGFTAYMVEARFNVDGMSLPLTFTTEVSVVPDVLPFKDKPME